ncbi:hypothetical protein B9Z55_008386 [Caenorhabditis nigoni]|uniref:Uncharacterized protein n=1 Tax=Caenorhabditis nigoni TaxID=1611254 RepID=A0A2G5UMI7_9PELO|nr:hypothetical protein B9Z55_008386 [Caenorhabditis nigoni]
MGPKSGVQSCQPQPWPFQLIQSRLVSNRRPPNLLSSLDQFKCSLVARSKINAQEPLSSRHPFPERPHPQWLGPPVLRR